MVRTNRTDASDRDFTDLVRLLDADLAVRDGALHPFYDQFNTLESIRYVIVAYDGTQAVACGAIKHYDAGTMEVKRMFTLPECRGRGAATSVLNELEAWAIELGYGKCILETGWKQPEAIALYTKNGYRQIPNYGQYAGVENSVCFEKTLVSSVSRREGPP